MRTLTGHHFLELGFYKNNPQPYSPRIVISPFKLLSLLCFLTPPPARFPSGLLWPPWHRAFGSASSTVSGPSQVRRFQNPGGRYCCVSSQSDSHQHYTTIKGEWCCFKVTSLSVSEFKNALSLWSTCLIFHFSPMAS